MRQFRTRGKEKIAIEFTLASIAYNLTRMYSFTHSDEHQPEAQTLPG